MLSPWALGLSHASSGFLWALALLASNFHGWFRDHVPNLEPLTQAREQATWQMPWAFPSNALAWLKNHTPALSLLSIINNTFK